MTINIQRVNYITILGNNEVTSANYERVNWSGRNWNVHTLKSKTTTGKDNCQWNENISATFVVNKQRSFGLTGYLLAKFFFSKISENGWRLSLWAWHPVGFTAKYTEAFLPKAGLLSLAFHHLKGNWRHQSSTAVSINKFSCCNTSQFKHLQGPSDLRWLVTVSSTFQELEFDGS